MQINSLDPPQPALHTKGPDLSPYQMATTGFNISCCAALQTPTMFVIYRFGKLFLEQDCNHVTIWKNPPTLIKHACLTLMSHKTHILQKAYYNLYWENWWEILTVYVVLSLLFSVFGFFIREEKVVFRWW